MVAFLVRIVVVQPGLTGWGGVRFAAGQAIINTTCNTIHRSGVKMLYRFNQCCGSGSVLDPYSRALWIQTRSPDTDQDPHKYSKWRIK